MTTEALHVPDRVLQIASDDPNRLALIHIHRTPFINRTTTTTYAQLSQRAEALALGLRDRGIGEGTLCSFMVPPGEDAMVVALAMWRVGAVLVGIEPHSHGMRTVARCLDRVGPTVFFGPPEAQAGRKTFGWGRRTVSTAIVTGVSRFPGLPTITQLAAPHHNPTAPPLPARVAADDPALIAFTTGSTGTPKPAVMTQQNVSAMIDGIGEQWQLAASGDVIDMPTFPIFWIIGLFHGGTVVVPPMDFALRGPGSANPAKLVAAINDHNVHSMFGSPALLTNLARYCNERSITLPTITRIVAGGAEVYGPLYSQVKQALPSGELYSNYGATEALPVAEIAGDTVLGETWARTEAGDGLCVGAPLPHVEARIVAIDDGPIATMADATEMNTGEIGELVVRSPHISDRYFNAPDDMVDNKIDDVDGKWHRLGDCGFVDEQGRLWVCGRRSHRVVTESATYFPLRCEPVFNTHPDVARCALIGPRLTSGLASAGTVTPTICVELTPEARVRQSAVWQELREMADKFDATRGIERFVFLDHLPVDKRHNAKIDRPGLARQFSSQA